MAGQMNDQMDEDMDQPMDMVGSNPAVSALSQPQRVPLKDSSSRQDFRREDSESSIKVDTIFSGGSRMFDSSNHTKKNASSVSSINMLNMSLTEMTQDQVNAARFAERKACMKAHMRRQTGEGNYGAETTTDMNMSNTTLSDFGSESLTRLGESQDNLSYTNIFEETEMYAAQAR